MSKVIEIIDKDSGEVEEIRRYKMKPLHNVRGWLFWATKKHARMFLDAELDSSLTDADLGRFYRLAGYICNYDNLLGKRSGVALRLKDISEILNLSERNTRRFLKKMDECKMIRQIKLYGRKWYIVNPMYVQRGRYITYIEYATFKDELYKVLPASAISSLELGAENIEIEIC